MTPPSKKLDSNPKVGVPGWHFCLFAADAMKTFEEAAIK